MARIVMKFGGTSMAGMERIRNVAARVKHVVDQGHEVAVVVSAMAGETDRLVGFCKEASALYDPAEYDVVVAAGELAGMAAEGWGVGVPVAKVGATVGSALGAVGFAVGGGDGLNVGFSEGENVGLAVGNDVVGLGVGDLPA